VPAVAAGRVSAVPEDLLQRPGPRIIEGLERLSTLLAESR
jgi:hypothetical protein